MSTVLRDYQVKLKEDIYAAWNDGARNVLAIMPTGCGKTRTFVSIAIDMALDPNGPKKPTAILVHRKELVQQISLTLTEEGVRHNIIAPRNAILGIIAAQRQLFKRQYYDVNAPITVISVDTLNARSNVYSEWVKKILLCITDEAAHVLANNKWGKALGLFENAIGLGVTATPRRLDKRGLGRHADGVFDVMVEGPGTRWAITNGYLSRYKVAVPDSDYKNYLKKASEGSDYTREAMAEASSKSQIVGDAVKNYLKFAEGKQAIYFCSDISSGNRMEEAFLKAGITAKLLTGTTDDKVRLQSLIDFREKKIKVLLNVDLFDEGLDVPGIEVVGLCRPTLSVGKFLQMIGRGLRVLPGKEHCIVIDHVGNVQEHGIPDRPRAWTLDRIVKRREKINLVRICGNFECSSPFDRIETECPYCGWKIPKPAASDGGGRPGPEQVDGDLELLDPETLQAMYDQTVLEDPGKIGERVGRVAGAAAALKAQKNQRDRIDTQKKLSDTIAKWAGLVRHGYTDRQIHKKFFLDHDMTITMALSEPRAEMENTISRLESVIEGLEKRRH